MRRRTVFLVSGVLLAAGAVAAISAPGPRGHHGDALEGMDHMEAGRRHGGGRGWFSPRSITADEYDTKTRERFARLDKNGDGILDAAEIEAAVKLVSGGRHGLSEGRQLGGKPGEGAAHFLRMFGDKDGKVVKDAFLAEAKRRFGQIDLNNDGTISDDDLSPMMRGKGILKADSSTDLGRMGPMGHMVMDLRQADIKRDAVITLEAYLAVQTRRFDEMDRNKDGVIDTADFDLARKEMADYQVKRFLHAYGADALGKVTKEQFYAVAKERFARLDRKGEGKITFDAPWAGGRWRGHDQHGEPGAEADRGPPPAAPKN